jgi:hypothetical protein
MVMGLAGYSAAAADEKQTSSDSKSRGKNLHVIDRKLRMLGAVATQNL